MKASEFLKKIGTIERAEIWIEFKENKKDAAADIERLTEYTAKEQADQIVERAAGYTLQEVRLEENAVTITAVRIEKRTSKQKPEKKPEEKRAEQKKEIAEEWERLEQAVDHLLETIAAPFLKIGKRAAGGRFAAVIKRARAAVRRILTRIFRERKIDG